MLRSPRSSLFPYTTLFRSKYSKRFTVATTRIATDDASIAGLASVPKRGPSAGAAWSGSGPDRAHRGRDGGVSGHQACGGRSEEHTSDYSQANNSYSVFILK